MIIPVSVSGSTFTARERFPFVDGQQVSIDSRIPNQVPAPLVEFDSSNARVYYFLVNISGSSFQVAETLSGPPITLTGSGTGQITVSEYPPLSWQQLVDLPLVRPSDIRARWMTPETMLSLTAGPDAFIGVTVASSVFTAGVEHGMTDWTAVRFTTTNTLPAPLAVDTTYYLRDTTATTFKLATVIGGGALTITTAGTGQASFQNYSLNDVIEAKIKLGMEWLYDAELVRVTNHVKNVGRSWWWWFTPPVEPADMMFYPASLKAQIVLDNLRNPEKLIEAIREYTKWAMVEDGGFRSQIRDASFYQDFGVPSSGQTLESVAKKRAEQRLATQEQLLMVSGNQGAQRLFEFGQMTDSISMSLI